MTYDLSEDIRPRRAKNVTQRDNEAGCCHNIHKKLLATCCCTSGTGDKQALTCYLVHGNVNPVIQLINTSLQYTMFWLLVFHINIRKYFKTYKDKCFLLSHYHVTCSMMKAFTCNLLGIIYQVERQLTAVENLF